MKSVRFISLFTLLVSTTTLAQSNPVPPIHRSLLPKSAGSDLSMPDPAAHGKIVESYGKLPLSFEANQGQTDAKVKFLSRGSGYTLFLTGNEAVFSLRSGKGNGEASPAGRTLQPNTTAPTTNAVLRMKLLHANPAAQVTGADELSGKSNYFIGNDPKKWRTNVPTYAKVKYEGVYSGIDLVYYGNQRQLEYDFVVAPGADPRRIQFDVRGANRISRAKDGDLVLDMAEGEVRWHKPVAYQEKDGIRQAIGAHYVIKQSNRIGFEVADYDARMPLFIDPLVYSTYLGGSNTDQGHGIVVDSSGNAYVTGFTNSTNFPTVNPLQPANAGNDDAFVTKLNSSGSALVYSTYLGGSAVDWGNGIAVDSAGDAYVTGYTASTDFPTMNPLQPANAGNDDAFVAQLNPSGSALVYSTYLGGSGADVGFAIAVDSSGDAYVTGYTASTDFPTMNPLQPAFGGIDDAFVAKVNPSGSTLVYSTYLGGSAGDVGFGIGVDSSGDAYVTGYTASTNFPTMNPLQPANNGGAHDAFVAQLNPSGSTLVYSTYLGGSGDDVVNAIAVDISGDAYITGYTASTNFPTMNPLQPANNGGAHDAFVAQLNPTGSALVYSTYLGGSGDDYGNGIVVDSSGDAYVTGQTTSTNFPTMFPFQPANAGVYDAFVTNFNPAGSALVYSTYLGGSDTDQGLGIAVDSSGNAYVTGYTISSDFPTTPSAFQTICNGGSNCSTYGDAFVAKVSLAPSVTLSPPSLNFGNQNVGTTSAPQNVTLTNSGDAALNISSIVASGDFSQTNTCPVGGSLQAGSNCTITVTFTPANEGTRTGAVTITDNASNSPQAVSLTGVGVAPVVMLSPPSLNFGNQTVGIPSSSQTVTLTNTGNATLSITSISAGANNGSVAATSTCGSSLAAGASCKVSVSWIPGAPGNMAGNIKFTDNAPNSPQAVPLTGVGVLPAVTFSPPSLTFPDQTIFSSSKPQTVTLSNTGLGILTITSIAASGSFTQTNTCGSTVNPGASCTISVTFKPRVKGTLTGSVSVNDNAPGSPQRVSLTGTGTYIQLKPTSVNFGSQPVGTKSLPKNVTVTNKGSVSVTISGISITGTDAGDFAIGNNTCGTSLASGASCFVKVTFTPLAKGKRTADLSVSDNGGGSPQQVAMSGTGT